MPAAALGDHRQAISASYDMVFSDAILREGDKVRVPRAHEADAWTTNTGLLDRRRCGEPRRQNQILRLRGHGGDPSTSRARKRKPKAGWDSIPTETRHGRERARSCATCEMWDKDEPPAASRPSASLRVTPRLWRSVLTPTIRRKIDRIDAGTTSGTRQGIEVDSALFRGGALLRQIDKPAWMSFIWWNSRLKNAVMFGSRVRCCSRRVVQKRF